MESSNPPAGAVRYYRWRMFFPTNTNFSGRELGAVVNKLLIVGDGCGERCRVIVTYGPRTGMSDVNMSVQIDGGVDPISVVNLPKGQWLNIQIEVRGSGDGNGGYKIWINNDNYSSPSAQIGNIQLDVARVGPRQVRRLLQRQPRVQRRPRLASRRFRGRVGVRHELEAGGGGGGPTPPGTVTGVRVVTP